MPLPDLSHLGEFGIVRLFRDAFPPHPGTVGIGDDCAVLDLGDTRLLVTTDLLVEGVHFLPDVDPGRLGWKAMAVNVSDIAAMGGEPVAAVLGLGLPANRPSSWVVAFRDGLLACAQAFGVDLVGGDTVAAPSGVLLSLTLLGRASPDGILLRSRGRPGDTVYLGGPVGGSAAGLHLVLHPDLVVPDAIRDPLLRAHLEPVPQVDLGRRLVAAGCETALDVSDGVLQDLGHICEESGVGAELRADALPIPDAARALGRLLGIDPLDGALSGGEDYVLLFAAPKDLPVDGVHPIGVLTDRPGIRLLRDGTWKDVAARGYDHFHPDPR